MKRFLLIAIAMSCATMLMAEGGFSGIDKVAVKLSSVSTSATADSATTSKVTGYLERIDLTFANTTSSVAVVVSATNAYTGASRTLLSVMASNNATYMVRDSTMDTSGTAVVTNEIRFVLLDETIKVTGASASYVGQDVLATVIYERP